MRFSSATFLLASVATVCAQGVQHQILVGANGTLTYSPPNITAAIGDTVQFVFQTKNHTMTQSTFADPCTEFTNTSIADPTKQVLTSGFMPVPANATSFPTFTIQITQSTPLWFYCQQTGHCVAGMVGAINVNEASANTFEAYQANAKSGASTGTSTGGGNGTATTPSSSTGSGTPTSSAKTTQSSGAAVPNLVPMKMSASVGFALIGVAVGASLL